MKKCLVIVDYQNDFVSGSLGFKKAEDLDDIISEKIKRYRNAGFEIVFTLDTHGEDYLYTSEGKMLPVKHCIKGTHGHKLFGKTAAAREENDCCFEKNTFGSQKLFEYFKEMRFDEVEFCGVITNICVIANAVLAKTALPQAKISVDSNCVASNDDTLNGYALDVMKSMQIYIK